MEPIRGCGCGTVVMVRGEGVGVRERGDNKSVNVLMGEKKKQEW